MLEARILLSADAMASVAASAPSDDLRPAFEVVAADGIETFSGQLESPISDALPDLTAGAEPFDSFDASSADQPSLTVGSPETEPGLPGAPDVSETEAAVSLESLASAADIPAELEAGQALSDPQPVASVLTLSAATESVDTLHAANAPPADGTAVTDSEATASRSVGLLSIGKLDDVSTGHVPSKVEMPTSEAWSGTEKYIWDISDATGTEGSATGWDFLDITGGLSINATSSSRFEIELHSVTSTGSTLDAVNFDNTSSYAWRILHTTEGIQDFDRAKFTLNDSAFTNDTGSGTFLLDLSANERDLILRFVPSLPSAVSFIDAATWQEQGPFSIINNSNTIVSPDNPVIGAVQMIASHPTNPAIAYLASVSGGVWKSVNSDTANPTWTPISDRLPSLAISAVAISPFDADGSAVTNATPEAKLVLFAGTGSFSSAGKGGEAAGLFRSTDGGATWIEVGTFDGLRVTAIVPSSTTAGMVMASTFDVVLGTSGGLYRTLNNGQEWKRLSGKGTPALPEFDISDMVQEPGNAGRFYVSLSSSRASGTAGTEGVYRADNANAVDETTITWTKVVNGLTPDYDRDGTPGEPAGANLATDPAETLDRVVRIRLAVAEVGTKAVYAAILGPDHTNSNQVRFAGIFRSTDQGGTWVALAGSPQTNPTGQGEKHFALVADPLSDNRVYIAGAIHDTSPYVGIAFRYDGDTTTWTEITTDDGSGPGAFNTAPHGDIRHLAFSANDNDLLLASDGGIYRLQNPRVGNASPEWKFVGQGLRITEIGHSVGYDHNTNTVFAGTQDVGVVRQTGDSQVWDSLTGGDGNYVAAGYSGTTTTRYYMSNNFTSFYRRDFTNPSNPDSFSSQTTLALKSSAAAANYSGLDSTQNLGLGTDQAFTGFQRIPFAVNAVNSSWLLMGRTMVYASTDKGDTIRTIAAAAPTTYVTALVYGGFEGATGKAGVMVMARGNTVFVSSDDGVTFKSVTPAGANSISHIALDPTNWRTGFAVDDSHIWLLTVAADGSVTAQDVTGNLSGSTGGFEAVATWRRDTQLFIAAGARDGVYWLRTDDLAGLAAATPPNFVWSRLGDDLPNVVVTDLVYDATDDILVAGTQGRGAWTLSRASRALDYDSTLWVDTGTADDTVTIRRADAPGQPDKLEVLVASSVIGTFELATIRTISVHTGAGDDTLIIDSVNGEVSVPGGIHFDGGANDTADPGDKLSFTGPVNGGLETDSEDNVEIRQMGSQKVFAVNVETFEQTTFFEDFVAFWKGVWDHIVGFFEMIGDGLSSPLPVIGDALGTGLNGGDFLRNLPIGFPSVNGPVVGTAIPGSGGDPSSLWRRLFESGSGFRPEDLGTLITTDAAFQAVLDSLDDIPGNVTASAATQQLIFGNGANPFRRTVAFEAPINVDLMGGLLQIHGSIGLALDVELRMEMGIDSKGFYLATNATAQPEFTIRNLRVTGSLTATGNLGLLAITLEDVTLSVDPNVRIEVNIKEPADPYGHPNDGKIRLYEFVNNPAAFFDFSFLTAGGDDLTLETGIRVAAMEPGGPPLFDIPLATLQIIWPEITNPLEVTIKPVGGPAEYLYRFLNFRIDDFYGELKRTLNSLGGISGSALLDLDLPFGSGLNLGGTLDFGTAFLDKIFAKLVDVQLVASTGNGKATGKLALGQLTADAKFTISIDGGPGVDVTVTAASTSANGSLNDLVVDINAALTGAGLSGKVEAILNRSQIALELLAGANLKIDGDASNPAFTEIGFTRNSSGMSLPKFPTLQGLLAELNKLLAPFDITPQVDLANNTFAIAINFSYPITESAQFKYDPSIGLGDLVDVSASGDFSISGTPSISFTLGVDLGERTVPKLITSPTLPPPSNGKTTADSTFTINLNDGEYRHTFTLSKSVGAFRTDDNSSVANLVADLNGLLGTAPAYQGTPLQRVIRFVATSSSPGIILEAINEDLDADGKLDTQNEDTNGNGVLDSGEDLDNDGLLDVDEDASTGDAFFDNNTLDSWLGKITSIAIEADNDEPIVTEVGFNNVIPAKSANRGIFLENVQLGGTLTVSANNLAAKARFAIFEIATSNGSATGTLTGSLKLKNPHDATNPGRLDVDLILKHIADLGSYVTPDTEITGSVDIQLNNITVSPNIPTLSGNPLVPPGSQFRIYIPDIHNVEYNPDPYDATTNNKGTFVTYPKLGAMGDFRCTSFLDVIAILDSLSDQLEGLKAFSFLSEPLPLINVSVSDVLDFAGDLSRAFQSLASGDSSAITKLESDLEKLFGVDPSKFSIALDDARVSGPAGGLPGAAAVARFNPSGQKNALVFTAKSNGAEFNDWQIDFDDDGSFADGVNDASVVVDSANKTLKVTYNATYTTAAKVVQVVNAAGASPFTVDFDKSASPTGDGAANDGLNTITETAIKFHLEYGLAYGNLLPLSFSLGEIVNLLPAGHPARAVLEGVSDIVQIEGSANLNVTASATLSLDFGLDVSGGCNLIPFLYDTTALTLQAAVRATGVNLSAGIGSLKISIKNGTVTLDGDGNAATTTDSASFGVAFKDNNGDGRHYFRSGESFFDSDNIGLTLTAAASANLPLFALDSLPIGSTSDGPDDGSEPDNWLVFQSGPLDQLFTGDTSAVVLRAPDISSLFDNISPCDLVNNPEILVDGLDALLGVVQDGLGNKLSRNLPLVGDQFGNAADSIMEFRTGLLAQLRQTLAEGGDPITLAKKAIFEALGTPGLDILAKADGSPLTSADEIDIKCESDGIKFNLRLKRTAALIDTSANPIDFDLGIPGLGLSVDGNVKMEVGFDLKLKFAISATDGFYLDTSDSEELRVDFNLTIPGLKAKGQLLFLQLEVLDESDGVSLAGDPRDLTHFTGYFSVNLKDTSGSGNKLTFADMTGSGFTFDKFIDAELGAEAKIALDLILSFGGDTRFPRLLAEFDLDWNWALGGDEDGNLEFGFHNVSLDVGSFIADFMGPILEEVSKITKPLQPVVDVITAPLPLISDLAGEPFSLLDMAEAFGMISPSTRKFIDVLVIVIRLANSGVTSDGSILLPLGSFDLQKDKYGNVERLGGQVDPPAVDLGDIGKFVYAPEWAGGKVAKLGGQTVGKANVPGNILSFLDDLEEIGITLPFLSIGEISKLFLGEPISLFEYHIPTLDFEAGFELSIPIIGPLYVKFGGSISAYADLTIGFDTFGIQKFFNSEDKDVLDIFDGFYIKDVDKDGKDVPELTLGGSLYAAGSIDIVIAEAGVRGGVEVTVDFNLNDPDDDGRVRISEIIANARQDIRCIFDVHGEMKLFLEAYLIIDLFFFEIDATWRFAEITLLEFDIVCPQPVLANYVDAGGAELEDADSAGSLRLNMGPYADERELGDTVDGDETYTVTHIADTAEGETVEVAFGGIKQTYYGVKKIWARGGAGNDTIDLRGVTSPVDSSSADRGVHGDDGNDTIYAGRGGGRYDGDNGNDTITAESADDSYTGREDEFHGGAGDDTLTGLEGDDDLYGDDGSDTIDGGLGNDNLYGGAGNDSIAGAEGDDTIEGNDDADTIDAGEGNDVVMGGAGDDTISGGLGDDWLIGEDSTPGGDYGSDTIDGGLGNDVLVGDDGLIVSFLEVQDIQGTGNDLLAGGPGSDVLFGGGGRDSLYGGTLLVSGVSTPGDTDPDTEDFLDGSDGDDLVFADDAHSAAATTFPGANIGDSVWLDSPDEHGVRNNVRDEDEKGVAGIKVALLDAASVVVAQTTTGADGTFKFTGLKGGDYKLRFTLPTGLAFVDKNIGSDAEVDSDVDPGTALTDLFHVDDGQIDYSRDAGVHGTTPLLVIDSPSVEEGDTGITQLVFTVTLSSVSDEIVLVCYESTPGVGPGGAKRIDDYASVSYTLVFQPGETVKTVSVPIVGDTMDELDETFTVTLSDPWAAEIDPGHAVGVGTIIDDDEPPVITVVDGVQVVPAGAPIPEGTDMTFVIRLSNPSYQPISVEYLTQQVVDSSGLRVFDGARPGAGLDYSAALETAPGTVTFASGEVEKTIVVPVFDDALDEYNEQFHFLVRLAPVTPSDAAVVGRALARARIADDDAMPFVEFIPNTYSTPEGHAGNTAVQLSVHLSAVSGRDVTFDWNTTRGTAVNAAPEGELPDFVYAFETVTFREGETVKQIEVEIVGDTRLEPNEEFFVNLLRANNAQINVVAADLNHAIVTITNDEVPDPGPWYVEFARTHYEVRESEELAVIHLVRAEGSSEPVAVYWTIGGTATPGLDYTGVWENGTSGPRGVARFAPGETVKEIAIPIVNNDAYEGDETITLHLLNPTGGPVRAPNDTAVITIVEDDPLPKVWIFAVNLIGPDWPEGVSEDALPNDPDPSVPDVDITPRKMVFDIVAEGSTEVPVSVDWSAVNGTAIAAVDFLPVGPVTVTFPPFTGQQLADVEVTIIDDLVSEDMESIYGQLTNPVNAEISGFQDIGYIYDDDLAQVTGFVFYDANNNGFYDASTDWGLGGVTVKIQDFENEYTVTTSTVAPIGQFQADVLLGPLVVTVDESTTPEDSIVTTDNHPLLVTASTTVLTLDDIGFYTPPKKAKPDTSTGNGLAFFNDVAYGGSGNDVLDGGPGNDWLIGGHWLGPGCSCAGVGYDAQLIQQPANNTPGDGGKRIYVNPATIPAPGTIQGRVWLDGSPADNREQDAEPGVKDIQVNLFDSNWVLVGITYTNASGAYQFTKLAACDYYVQFMAPSGYTYATPNVGSDDRDSDANASTGLTDSYQVNAGQTVSNIDAGFRAVPPGSAGPWSLQFSQVVYSVRETDGFATITILRTPNSFQPVGTYWTEQVTATNNADYIGIWENQPGVGRRTISFGVDENEKSFIIPIVLDTLTETPPEYFYVQLKNPTGGPVYGNLPTATVLIFDNPCPDNDKIYGQDGNDVMLGDFGYFTNAGKAELLGGVGDDELIGGVGADEIYGEGGNDLLEGGADDDKLDGGGENDTFRFDGDKSLGNDQIFEVASPFGGNDTIDLSQTSSRAITLDLGVVAAQPVTQSLTLTLPAGNVIENVTGGDQNDVLTGNALDNRILGGTGDDRIEGKGGDDELRGGRGSDTYVFDADSPLGHDDVFEGTALFGFGLDEDLFDFSATTTQGVSVDLGSNLSQTVNANLSLTLSNARGIEHIYGGSQNDSLIGNKNSNRIRGGAGNDNLDGGPLGDSGSDTLVEERGGGFNLTNTTLTLTGTGEVDTYADFENVSLTGDDNANELNASTFSGEVHLDGRGGNDTITGGTGVNFLTGGAGNDTITANGVDTIIEQRDANFTLTNTQLLIGGETDTYVGTIEFAELTGGDGDNVLNAAAFTTGTVTLDGGAGDDTLTGTAGADTLIGGAGDDSLVGGAGDDTYSFDADSSLSGPTGDLITETAAGGTDTVDFSGTNSVGVAFELGLTTAQTVNANLVLTLTASNGIEHVRGGGGNDTLIGNALVNRIEGLGGADVLTGRLGNDILDGGSGSDRVFEDRNVNMVLTDASLGFAGGESDSLTSIELATLIGGAGANTLDASAFTGSSRLEGQGGNDVLLGGSGADTLVGGAGDDTLTGGAANDVYLFDADTNLGTDTVNELVGGGTDTLDYSGTEAAIVTVNLSTAAAQLAARTPPPGSVIRHTLDLSGGSVVENIMGGMLDDILTGNSLANRLEGRAGADTLTGAGGNDWLQGGDDADTYVFDADVALGTDHIWEDVGTGGTDTLDFSTTASPITVDLGEGEAQTVNANLTLRLIACHSLENVVGGAGADSLTGNTLDNRITGGGGNDSLIGNRGNDTFVFDADLSLGSDNLAEDADSEGGLDALDFSATTTLPVTFDLSDSTPPPQAVNANLQVQLSSGSAFENIKGGQAGNTLRGNALDNVLVGGAGNDSILAALGDDLIEGRGGNDTLTGGSGNDTYKFNADTDTGTATIVETASGGVDTLDFSASTAGVTVNLSNPAPQAVTGSLSLDLQATDRIEHVIGGAGNDVLRGNGLENILNGGAGDDRYVFDADANLGSDIILEASDVTGGSDTLDFSLTTTFAVTVDLSVTTRQTVVLNTALEPDEIHLALELRNANSVENVIGSALADQITGNDLDNTFSGGLGNDTMKGGLGTDTVLAVRDANMTLSNTALKIGSETDTLSEIEQALLTGGASANTLDASAFTLGPVTFVGGGGNDVLRGGASTLDQVLAIRDADMVLANNLLKVGADSLTLSSIETATLVGGTSANTLDAGAFTLGSVILVGGDGADVLRGGAGDDQLTGGLGDDTLSGGAGGNDQVVESRDDDFFLKDESLLIGFETDTLAGIESADLSGGTGNNTLDASAFTLGKVTLRGGTGDDLLFGSSGDDLLDGGEDNDTLAGGLGGDTYRVQPGWGSDVIIEAAAAGSDTIECAGFDSFATLRHVIKAGILVTDETNAIRHTGENVEEVIGGEGSDSFNVTPSATLALTIDGGAGTGDVLNYDALNLATTQTAVSLTTTGFQPVSFLNIETVNILNGELP